VSEDNTGQAHVAEISTQEIGEYAPEDQIRIVLKGFRTKVTASDLCWTKEFMEAGKERLTGDTILMPPAGRSNTSSGRTTT